eukprot:scaffold505_cov49-Attheya_sp.AAC.5
MMRAVRCHGFAALDEATGSILPNKPALIRTVLSLDEGIEAPTLQNDTHVLIQAHFAGVQYPDFLQAQGLYQHRPKLPYIPGMDVAGVVIEKGAGVADEDIQIGDAVVAQSAPDLGCLADVVRAQAQHVFPLPKGVRLSQCANIGRNFFAANQSLRVLGKVQPHDLVLVDGASGGVGMATVELAKAMGATVIAAVSSLDKAPYPKQAGADVVLTYGHNKTSHAKFKMEFQREASRLGHEEGANVIVDVVQGDLFENALLSCLKPLGTICLVGFAAGQKPIRPGLLLVKEANVVGSLWARWAQQHPIQHRQHVEQILRYMEMGAIRPRADCVFPLHNFLNAFELFENNQARGNTVIDFGRGDIIGGPKTTTNNVFSKL